MALLDIIGTPRRGEEDDPDRLGPQGHVSSILCREASGTRHHGIQSDEIVCIALTYENITLFCSYQFFDEKFVIAFLLNTFYVRVRQSNQKLI